MKRRLAIATTVAISVAMAWTVGVSAARPGTLAAALPDFPGGSGSQAFDVNDAGQIVGWALTAGGDQHAALWQDGSVVDLGTLPGDTGSFATAVSDNGLVVGISGDGPLGPFNPENDLTGHAVLWRYGQIIDLGLLPGGAYSWASDVNDDGQVVGSGQMSERGGLSLVNRGFLWENGTFAILPPLQPESDRFSTASFARGINDRGQIIGSSVVYDLWADALTWRAVTWRDGVPVDLGTIADGSYTSANAISENAKIAGGSAPEFGVVGFAIGWIGGRPRALPQPEGAIWTIASGVNDAGVFVGQYATADEMIGCRWVGRTVSALLPLAGDVYGGAEGINDRGLVVGWSQDLSLTFHAVTWQ